MRVPQYGWVSRRVPRSIFGRLLRLRNDAASKRASQSPETSPRLSEATFRQFLLTVFRAVGQFSKRFECANRERLQLHEQWLIDQAEIKARLALHPCFQFL